MEHAARARSGARHWTGRILPVLCIALLTIGAVHAKESKSRKTAGDNAPVRVEPMRKVASAKNDDAPKKEDSSRREDPPQRQDPPKREDPPKAAPKLISMDSASEQVEKHHHAKVVRRDRGESGGRPVYKFRLLSDDDRVWTIVVDAETGEEL